MFGSQDQGEFYAIIHNQSSLQIGADPHLPHRA